MTLLPLAGALLAALNLLQQTHGDARLTLAILQNLSLTSLTFGVLFGLSTALSAGLAIGFSRIWGDRSMPPSVRRAASLGTLALLVVCLWTQIAPVFLAVLGICYVFWRFPPQWLRARDVEESVTALDAWFAPPQPSDSVLRGLWQRGQPMTVEDRLALTDEVNARVARINAVRPAGFVTAAWVVLFAIFGTYGASLLTTPVQLAPLEAVSFADGSVEVGYVFSSSTDEGIFVFRDMEGIHPLEEGEIATRQICWTPATLFSRTLVHAFSSEARPRGRAVC